MSPRVVDRPAATIMPPLAPTLGPNAAAMPQMRNSTAITIVSVPRNLSRPDIIPGMTTRAIWTSPKMVATMPSRRNCTGRPAAPAPRFWKPADSSRMPDIRNSSSARFKLLTADLS